MAGPYTLGAELLPKPGRYRIGLLIVHQDDGRAGGHGAWTGGLNAEPIEVKVVP